MANPSQAMVQLAWDPYAAMEYFPAPTRFQQEDTKPVPVASNYICSVHGHSLALYSAAPASLRNVTCAGGTLVLTICVWLVHSSFRRRAQVPCSKISERYDRQPCLVIGRAPTVKQNETELRREEVAETCGDKVDIV